MSDEFLSSLPLFKKLVLLVRRPFDWGKNLTIKDCADWMMSDSPEWFKERNGEHLDGKV